MLLAEIVMRDNRSQKTRLDDIWAEVRVLGQTEGIGYLAWPTACLGTGRGNCFLCTETFSQDRFQELHVNLASDEKSWARGVLSGKGLDRNV